MDEVGKDQNGRVVVRIDPKYFRPTEVDLLLGDPAKIQKELNWHCKVKFDVRSVPPSLCCSFARESLTYSVRLIESRRNW